MPRSPSKKSEENGLRAPPPPNHCHMTANKPGEARRHRQGEAEGATQRGLRQREVGASRKGRRGKQESGAVKGHGENSVRGRRSTVHKQG